MTRSMLIACLCLLASCQSIKNLTARKPKKDDTKKEISQLTIGTIDLVNPDQHFVLIRTFAHLMLTAGTELVSTNSHGQITKLKVSPEHKGSYLAADIVSGTPQNQDIVVYQATSKAPPALSGEKPVRGDITDITTPSLYQPPANPASPAESSPIPQQPPLPVQPPQ